MDNPISLLNAIGEEILRAIALSSLWSRCANAPDILVPVDNVNLLSFGLVRESIHKDLILTLTKLYDRGADDLSFARIFRAVENTGSHASVVNEAAYREAKEKFDAALDEKGLSAMQAIRLLRNKVLAHTDTRGLKQTAVYRHQRIVLEMSIDICEKLSAAFSMPAQQFGVFGEDWKIEAERFWLALIAGLPNEFE